MAIIITEHCRVYFMMPCPVCGVLFNKGKGIFVKSETLGDSVLVCQTHSDQEVLSVEQEVAVQESLARTIKSSEGHVSKGQKTVKKSFIMEKHNI